MELYQMPPISAAHAMTVEVLNFHNAMRAARILAGQIMNLTAAGIEEFDVRPDTLASFIADDLVETSGRLVTAAMAALSAVQV